jgi:hypothetical protein
MKIRRATDHPPANWTRTSRPLKPYTFHSIKIVDHEETNDTPSPRNDEWRLSATHLREPIHSHLLKIVPGDNDSIIAFATRLGLDELISWGMDLDPEYLRDPWLQLFDDISHPINGVAHVKESHLIEAWGIGSTVEAFREDLTALDEAYRYFADHGADQALLFFQDYWKPTHADADLDTWSFPTPTLRLVTWPIQPIDDDQPTLTIVEAPNHIFDRAWIELYDALQRDGVPTICPECDVPFIGQRKGQRFCGRGCQDKRPRTDEQREYERMYQRMRRGAITQDEFSAWQQRTGRPARDRRS